MTHSQFITSLLLTLLLVLTTSCKSSQDTVSNVSEITKVDQYAFDFLESESIYPILDKAAAENKLVFVDLYTSWCLPCKMMDEGVFSHNPTAEFMNRHFISYRVNAEKLNGPDLMLIYNAKSYPTLLFLDPKGRELNKKEGTAYPTEFLTLAQEAMDRHQLSN